MKRSEALRELSNSLYIYNGCAEPTSQYNTQAEFILDLVEELGMVPPRNTNAWTFGNEPKPNEWEAE